ncbi:hypothetical protein SPURM210S_05843 [Streptomyces purpurascens]
MLAALPKFLLASVLATVCGVWWGWFPSSGWEGPQSMVLPSLALGIPSGAMLGGLLDQALPAAFHEPWARTAYAVGLPPGHIGRDALRRTLPGMLPQLLPTVVALVGGAVAVEKIFNIPGLGRLALEAAVAQDLPVLQTATLALVLLGVSAGVLIRALRHALLGRPLRDGALPALHRPPLDPSALPALDHRGLRAGAARPGHGRACCATPWGSTRRRRLLSPSLEHPLGTDALGRDLLARLGHGAVRTAGVALAVTMLSAVTGLLLGMAPRASAGPTEVVSTLPAVLAGLLIAGVTGPSGWGAACAVCAVGLEPLRRPDRRPARTGTRERSTSPRPSRSGPGGRTCCAATCSARCYRPSSATPCSGCPPPRWSSPHSASSASAHSRRPPSGAGSCRRTSRTPNAPPGPCWVRPRRWWCSPCWR